MSAYDKFYDCISKLHKETGVIPSVQDVWDHFDLKTESEDSDSIIRDDHNLFEVINGAIQDYKRLSK